MFEKPSFAKLIQILKQQKNSGPKKDWRDLEDHVRHVYESLLNMQGEQIVVARDVQMRGMTGQSHQVSANNMNREHAYLRSVFNELAHLGYWKKENPLAKLRQFKIQETELSYLTLDQIQSLLNALSQAQNPHVLLVTKVCLATGARWEKQRRCKSPSAQWPDPICTNEVRKIALRTNRGRASKSS